MSCVLQIFWIKYEKEKYGNSNEITFTECVGWKTAIFYFRCRSLFDGESVINKTSTWFTTIFYLLSFRYILIRFFYENQILFVFVEKKIRRLTKTLKRKHVHLFSDRDGRVYLPLTLIFLYTRVCALLSSVATYIHLFASMDR